MKFLKCWSIQQGVTIIQALLSRTADMLRSAGIDNNGVTGGLQGRNSPLAVAFIARSPNLH